MDATANRHAVKTALDTLTLNLASSDSGTGTTTIREPLDGQLFLQKRYYLIKLKVVAVEAQARN
jgi:hypothetical protein